MSLGSKPVGDLCDFTKLFTDVRPPAISDMEALITNTRRNMEAMTSANRVAFEGAQAIARRYMEIMQQSTAELAEAVRVMSSVEAPQAKVAKQAKLLTHAYDRAISNLQEVVDLIQHSSAEAVKPLKARFVEAVEEVKALADQSKT